MLTLILLAFFITIFASCDKNNPSSPDDENNTVAGSTFMPLAVGNTWVYDKYFSMFYGMTFQFTTAVMPKVEYEGQDAWLLRTTLESETWAETTYVAEINDTLHSFDRSDNEWEPLFPDVLLESAKVGDDLLFSSFDDDQGEVYFKLLSKDATVTSGDNIHLGCYHLLDSVYVGAVDTSGVLVSYSIHMYYQRNLGLINLGSYIYGQLPDGSVEAETLATYELIDAYIND